MKELNIVYSFILPTDWRLEGNMTLIFLFILHFNSLTALYRKCMYFIIVFGAK